MPIHKDSDEEFWYCRADGCTYRSSNIYEVNDHEMGHDEGDFTPPQGYWVCEDLDCDFQTRDHTKLLTQVDGHWYCEDHCDAYCEGGTEICQHGDCPVRVCPSDETEERGEDGLFYCAEHQHQQQGPNYCRHPECEVPGSLGNVRGRRHCPNHKEWQPADRWQYCNHPQCVKRIPGEDGERFCVLHGGYAGASYEPKQYRGTGNTRLDYSQPLPDPVEEYAAVRIEAEFRTHPDMPFARKIVTGAWPIQDATFPRIKAVMAETREDWEAAYATVAQQQAAAAEAEAAAAAAINRLVHESLYGAAAPQAPHSTQERGMAQKTLAEKGQADVVIAKVVRLGDSINIPEAMTLEEAVTAINRQIQYEEEFVDITEVIPFFPWDGAIALKKAMEEKFGFVFLDGVSPWQGAREIAVANGVGTTVNVPWGKFKIPGSKDGNDFLVTSVGFEKGLMSFQVAAHIRRKYEKVVRALIEDTKRIAAAESIYKGKAIKIAFTDSDGDRIELPSPEFLDVSTLKQSDLIYRRDLEEEIEINLLTPLRYPDRSASLGVPLKRGVLLAGPYGTGKTMQAFNAARVATENGWTFLYINTPNELPYAIAFAKQYGRTVIYAEDIDRALAGTQRTTSMDEILNTLDGIDSKAAPIITILTTNHLDMINKAMLRPGRLDAVIEVLPPDAEAVIRLVKSYGRGLVDENTDLTPVGAALDGQIPAVVREVVERSKLAFVSRTQGKVVPMKLIADDIINATKQVKKQQELTAIKQNTEPHPFERFGAAMGKEFHAALVQYPGQRVDAVQEIIDSTK